MYWQAGVGSGADGATAPEAATQVGCTLVDVVNAEACAFKTPWRATIRKPKKGGGLISKRGDYV